LPPFRRVCYDASMPIKHIIVGTAGHIDHGKTSLVKALTGIDTDRLKEEKERGISIELGFANLALSEELHLGIVDVPGHERFVKTMLARGDALFVQGLDNPGATVRAVGATMDALDALQERVVGLRSRARGTGSPGVVAARRDPVLPAEELDPVLTAVSVYEREDGRLRAKLNWSAFFKRSFSMPPFFRAASSARMRFSSATVTSMAFCSLRSGWANPFNVPPRTSFFQRESMKGWMCKASATAFVSMSRALASFTAVTLNSLL
jgi:hypothetical protein